MEQIKTARPGILGCQEALNIQVVDLEQALPGYTWVGVGRDDGREGGEFAPIFVRQDYFKVLKAGTFWLSSSPDTPSTGWDAACPRIVTWVRLMQKGSGRKFYVFNTHLDHEGKLARELSTRMLLRKMQEITAGQPAMVMGDFNFTPESRYYPMLINRESPLRDTFASASGSDYTYPGSGFKAEMGKDAKRIDYIFATAQFRPISASILHNIEEGFYPSDHLPQLSLVLF